jgi:hypothetical protein
MRIDLVLRENSMLRAGKSVSGICDAADALCEILRRRREFEAVKMAGFV